VATLPAEVRTERLVVRIWHDDDAGALGRAITTSLDHLRPWMPWAHEAPAPVEQVVELLRTFRGKFDLGQDYVYGIFSADESEVVGGTGLHTRSGPEAFEIGYWIRASRAREGLATEVTAALTRVGFEVCEAQRIEIRVDPDNVASLGIPRKLGFVEEGRLRNVFHDDVGRPGGRDAVVFALLRDEFATTPAAKVEVRTFDAAGEPV
jgi:RimJ/RimL family protein N-acetyltransferase